LPTRGLPAVLLPTQWVESIGACEVPRRGCNRLTAAIPTRLGGGGGRAGCRIEYRKSAEGPFSEVGRCSCFFRCSFNSGH
jgi:hypothetical protein